MSDEKSESGWQDIATAPKTGEKVDLWIYWPEHDRSERSADATWDAEVEEWRVGQYTLNQFVHRPTVTHWMPLPEPPALTQEAKPHD